MDYEYISGFEDNKNNENLKFTAYNAVSNHLKNGNYTLAKKNLNLTNLKSSKSLLNELNK